MNPFVGTLHLRVVRSTCLSVVGLGAHGVAAVVIAWLAWSTALLWLCLLLPVLLSACYQIRHPLPAWHPDDGLFRWAADDRWYWQTRDDKIVEAECRDAQLWGAVAVRLRLREQASGRRRTLLLLFDAVDAQVHRQLRARASVRGRGRRAAGE